MISLHITFKHTGTKMEMAQADFLNIVTNSLVLSIRQREVLSDDGYYMTSTIIHWKYNEIREC